ncbi:MAG: sugar ABC transporter permease, partial [Pseudomonadota bacterium]
MLKPTQTDSAFVRFLRQTEIDGRLIGMVAALVLIWVGFHLYGHFVNNFGAFLTPRNLWNLSVQTASIGIMATGMVFVIVTRHIDLSVGSVLGVCAMTMAIVQVWILPDLIGIGHPAIWLIAVVAGLLTGTAIGALHGYLIAYRGIPAFIVTLGGLLVWRGVAFLLARGETISPVDPTFALLGGGPYGAIGEIGSWIVGGLACVGIVALVVFGR